MRLDPTDSDAIEEIVEKTVRRVLLDLNIDVSTPEKVLQFRRSMTELGEWQTSMRHIKQAGLLAAVGVIVSGVLAALWLGFQNLMNRGGS